MLTQKDEKALIDKANSHLSGHFCRVMLTDAPSSILSFYEKNSDKINGTVVVVRNKDDESKAASARNSIHKVLLVFAKDYYVSDYFTSTFERLFLTKALLERASKHQEQ